jgi:hypothetical protein
MAMRLEMETVRASGWAQLSDSGSPMESLSAWESAQWWRLALQSQSPLEWRWLLGWLSL